MSRRYVRVGGHEQRPAVDSPGATLQIVVGTDEHDDPKLDVIESAFEQTYRVGGHHSEALFLALSRKKGHLPFRHARQHAGTVSVRATLPEHDALWSEFLELDRQLGSQLAEVTCSFLREHVERKQVEMRSGVLALRRFRRSVARSDIVACSSPAAGP